MPSALQRKLNASVNGSPFVKCYATWNYETKFFVVLDAECRGMDSAFYAMNSAFSGPQFFELLLRLLIDIFGEMARRD